jgi:Raf kinase inhibitor-like YbhB/YbcL family protein
MMRSTTCRSARLAVGALTMTLGLAACAGKVAPAPATSAAASPSAKAAVADTLADTPYAHLPKVPSFTVTSLDVKDGEQMPKAQLSGLFGAGGSDTSPQLSWSGFPQGTKSFAVTVFDPDAPTGSGFWHWVVANIPVGVKSLAAGAGAENSTALPSGAVQIPNDARLARYVGAAPPAGSGTHRYFITVYALDVPEIKIDKSATPALLGSMLSGHTIARASIVPTATP